MNTIDIANAWVKLYELKTGKVYMPGLHTPEYDSKGQVKGTFLTIAEEIGIDKQTVWEYLQYLEEPKHVRQALEQGLPRTYIREANSAPESVRNELKKKIIAGDYKSREEIREDVKLAKQNLFFSCFAPSTDYYSRWWKYSE